MEASGNTKCCISQLTRNSHKDNQFIFPCQPPCLLLCVVYRSHNYNEVHRSQKNSTKVGTTVLKRYTNQYRYFYIRRQSKTEESAIKDDVSNSNTDCDSLHNLNFEWHVTCKKMLVVEIIVNGWLESTEIEEICSKNGKGKTVSHCWFASLERTDEVILTHGNRDEKAKSIFKIKKTGH